MNSLARRATRITSHHLKENLLVNAGSKIDGSVRILPTQLNMSNILDNRRTAFLRTGLEDVGLSPTLVHAIQRYEGITEFTPTQSAIINTFNHGRSMIIQSETGTGKSFGAMLSAINKVVREATTYRMHTLILVPTIDLGFQYVRWIQRYGGSAAHVAMLLPQPMTEHARTRLQNIQPHILIGTVDSVWDVMEHSKELIGMKLRRVLDTIIVDEADLILEHEKGCSLIDRLYRTRREEVPAQLIFLSASINASTVRRFNRWTADESKVLRVSSSHLENALPDTLTFYLFCEQQHTLPVILQQVIAQGMKEKGTNYRPLVFGRDKKLIHQSLTEIGFGSTSKDLTTRSNAALPSGTIGISDFVSARGLHIPGTTDVIITGGVPNPAEFVHVSGRTGRMGVDGDVTLLFTPQESRQVQHLCDVHDIPFRLSSLETCQKS
eukprot:PhF_6_TR43638/c0_g1_i1/m.67058